MEDGGDAPRVTLGQMQLNKRKDWFSRSLYLCLSVLIGIEWNGSCLVNVILNCFTKNRTSIKIKDLATRCWIASEVKFQFVHFVISTSFGMFESSWGYRCLLPCTFLSFPIPNNTNANFIYYFFFFLNINHIFLMRQMLTEIRSPFLQLCPMVLRIEEIKMKKKSGFDSSLFLSPMKPASR